MNYDKIQELMLKPGDKVALTYANGQRLLATLISTPQGEGDVWEFVDEEGNVFIQNVYFLGLNTIVRR